MRTIGKVKEVNKIYQRDNLPTAKTGGKWLMEFRVVDMQHLQCPS